jgi:nucleotidyltransferase substrate binding protein (TIGR01987 family)
MAILDLTPLARALAALQRGLLRWQATPDDEELRDACIQRFEFTFELCWKMLKRRLEMDAPNAAEIDGMSYRTLMRAGAEHGLLTEVTRWWVYRDKRNITSHTYDAAKAAEVAAVLPAFAQDAAALLRALEQRAIDTENDA